MSSRVLNDLTRQLRQRDLLVAVGMALVLMLPLGILSMRVALPLWMILIWSAPVIAFCGAWLEGRGKLTKPGVLAAHLDRRMNSLEDSAGLLLQTRDELPALQQLQRDRVAIRMATLPPGILPWPRRLLLIVAGIAALLGVVLASIEVSDIGGDGSSSSFRPLMAGDLESVRVRIRPLPYTGLDVRTVGHLDVDAEEGADLTFELRFQTAVADVHLSLDEGSELYSVQPGGRAHQISMTADQDRIFRLQWRDAAGPRSSDFHRLRLLRDQPPVLTVVSPERSPLNLSPGATPEAFFVLQAKDDYGVGATRILATVAKGLGEGVKFRDVALDFDSVESKDDGQSLTRLWRLPDLGMEPGDELYFRAEVSDNRQPEPNRSRTAMLMVRWESAEQEMALSIEGIAVDLLPEYFRSQRQIIIDTERLIKDAEHISRRQGTALSRGLAFDQKALRIRYGQYLGEEYSSDIGQAALPEVDEDDHGDESYADHLQHDDADHHDEAGPASPITAGLPEIMATFVHTHDSTEHATLFDEQTKETLKAALAAMWDAELQLHLSRPRQALPFEYRALDLLKQVQQADRIYVRRVGFEPPVLDEGKRLTGELDDVLAASQLRAAEGPLPAPLERALTDVLRNEPGSATFRAALVLWRNHLGANSDEIETRLVLTRLLNVAGNEATDCEHCLDQIRGLAMSGLSIPQPAPRQRELSGSGKRADQYLDAIEGSPQ